MCFLATRDHTRSVRRQMKKAGGQMDFWRRYRIPRKTLSKGQLLLKSSTSRFAKLKGGTVTGPGLIEPGRHSAFKVVTDQAMEMAAGIYAKHNMRGFETSEPYWGTMQLYIWVKVRAKAEDLLGANNFNLCFRKVRLLAREWNRIKKLAGC